MQIGFVIEQIILFPYCQRTGLLYYYASFRVPLFESNYPTMMVGDLYYEQASLVINISFIPKF